MPYRKSEAARLRQEAKRSRLLRAARQIVATRGFSGAKATAIARASGVSVGSIYSYFEHREELLATVFRDAAGHELDAVRTAVEACGPDPADRLEELVRTFAGRAMAGQQLAWALLFEPVGPAVEAERLVYRRHYAGLAEEILRDGVKSGAFPPQDIALSSTATIGAIGESLVGRLRPAQQRHVQAASPHAAGDEGTAETPEPPAPLADALIVEEILAYCFRAVVGAPPRQAAPARGHPAEDPTTHPARTSAPAPSGDAAEEDHR